MNKKLFQTDVRQTKDGSTTLFSEKFSQHYHNPNGATSESRFVFYESLKVEERLQKENNLAVFEMGFGTGLNLLLMLDVLTKSKSSCHVDFWSVEAFPVDEHIAEEFNFGTGLDQYEPISLLKKIFRELKPGMNQFQISDSLKCHLFYGPFDEMPNPDQKVDFIFHDPFSPEVNSELWSVEIFNRLAGFSKSTATLSTYCAASSARAAMAVAGWKIAKTRGALGKREMTLASLDENNLKSFKRVNEQRLIDRFKRGDFE